MDFRFHHSLASRAAVSVTLSLWYHEDIDSLKRIDFDDLDESDEYIASRTNRYLIQLCPARRIRRLALHKKVTDNVSKLFLPKSLKRYLLEFVQIVEENLEYWIVDHYQPLEKITEGVEHRSLAARTFDIISLISRRELSESSANAPIDVDLRKVLRWKPDGLIDLEQTGEALVRNESDPIKRFKLACDYCKEDEILLLWPSVRVHFSCPDAWDSNTAYKMSALFWWRYFHEFWPESISTYLFHLEATESAQGTNIFLAELHYSCFSYSNKHCSPLALYLLNKNRIVHLSNIIEEDNIDDRRFGVIFFKLPEICREIFFRDFPLGVLKQLLFWRHQSFFADTVERNWDIFDERLFDSVLIRIGRFVECYEDSDIYRNIFRWYWTRSPASLRVVERIFYRKQVDDGYTLGYFVNLLFGHSPEAEDKMKRVLFEGEHVLELATNERVRAVLSDLVRACLPAEEWDGKLELMKKHFTVPYADWRYRFGLKGGDIRVLLNNS